VSGNERKLRAPVTVVVAMLANVALATAKFVVAVLTGSAAMFAEGVHSLVDSINQSILLVGARRSARPADAAHPFGYGKDVYFWALVYCVLLFGVGGGVSIFRGISALRSPEPIENFTAAYLVLAMAVVLEGISWLTAWRALSRRDRQRDPWRKLERATDPSEFAIVAEDGAAVIGALVAFLGLGLSQHLGSSRPDAIASIAIGVILCLAALAVTWRTRDLVLGQSAPHEVVRGIQETIEAEPHVRYTAPPLTMHLGPAEILAAINIEFDRSISAPQVARIVDRLERSIQERFPQVTRIFIEAQVGPADVEREQPTAR
jgi:cation diffusion facilitator family transporter